VLAAVARELEALAPSGVALWGCGQLLDSLVRHGGLKRDLFRQFGGSELRRNEDLAALSETQSGTIVVMADTLNAEVERAVAERGLPARIVHYSDLFLRAHRRLAA
jgi:hypothetical protein